MLNSTIVRRAAFCLWVEVPPTEDPDFLEICESGKATAEFDAARQIWTITTVSGIPEQVEPGAGVFVNEVGVMRVMTESLSGEFLQGDLRFSPPNRDYEALVSALDVLLELEFSRFTNEAGDSECDLPGFATEMTTVILQQLMAMITAFVTASYSEDPEDAMGRVNPEYVEKSMQIVTVALLNAQAIVNRCVAEETGRAGQRVH